MKTSRDSRTASREQTTDTGVLARRAARDLLMGLATDEVLAAAAAIANARVNRRGVPDVSNILDLLPEKLKGEVIEDAAVALAAAELVRFRKAGKDTTERSEPGQDTGVLAGLHPQVWWKYIGEELAFFWDSPYGHGTEKIATFWWPRHPPEATEEVERYFEEMAQLMTAAPALYAALDMALGLLRQLDWHNPQHPIWTMGPAALRMAKAAAAGKDATERNQPDKGNSGI